MPIQYKRCYCDECGRMVRADRQGFNHLPHLLVTMLCVGLWLPVWILLALGHSEPFRCPRCGFTLSKPTDFVRVVIYTAVALMTAAIVGVIAVATSMQ